MTHPDNTAADLFRRSFGSAPPDYPRHFVARLARPGNASAQGYVHFSVFEPDIYLCGGLCVDTRVYRRLTAPERSALAVHGSLSRWLLANAIMALGSKRAVFAYTGDLRSRRDAAALGFSATRNGLLFVQWHGEPAGSRTALLRRVEAAGPF